MMIDAAEIFFLSVLCVLPLGLASPADSRINSCKDGGIVYKRGQSWSKLGECQLNTCAAYGEVYVTTCAAMAIAEGSGWKISKMDLTKKYPQCCPQPIPPPSSTSKPKDSKCDVTKKETEDTKKETEDTKKETEDTKKETDDTKKETEDNKKETEGDVVFPQVIN